MKQYKYITILILFTLTIFGSGNTVNAGKTWMTEHHSLFNTAVNADTNNDNGIDNGKHYTPGSTIVGQFQHPGNSLPIPAEFNGGLVTDNLILNEDEPKVDYVIEHTTPSGTCMEVSGLPEMDYQDGDYTTTNKVKKFAFFDHDVDSNRFFQVIEIGETIEYSKALSSLYELEKNGIQRGGGKYRKETRGSYIKKAKSYYSTDNGATWKQYETREDPNLPSGCVITNFKIENPYAEPYTYHMKVKGNPENITDTLVAKTLDENTGEPVTDEGQQLVGEITKSTTLTPKKTIITDTCEVKKVNIEVTGEEKTTKFVHTGSGFDGVKPQITATEFAECDTEVTVDVYGKFVLSAESPFTVSEDGNTKTCNYYLEKYTSYVDEEGNELKATDKGTDIKDCPDILTKEGKTYKKSNESPDWVEVGEKGKTCTYQEEVQTFTATKEFTATETVQRDNCEKNFSGSEVEISVKKEATATADTQAKADSLALAEATKLAQAELENIKQTKANEQGTCTQTTFEATKSFTAKQTVQRDNCEANFIGTSVEVSTTKTATATAGTQEEADVKALNEATKLAQAELENIKQTKANEQGTCTQTIFEATKTVEQSQDFTRNNCEKNFIGSNVTYTATATKTATAETQAKADELATTAAQSAVDEDILANGQNFANTNGTCTQTTFEATKSFTAKETVEKNDCKVGEIPSKVEVSITKEATATADTQVKADEKALDEATKLAKTELEKIKQTEANKNGTCKKKAIEEPKPTPKPEKPTKPEKEPIKLIPRKANGSACDDCFKVKDDKNVIIENTVVTVKTDTTKEIKKVKEVQKEVKNKEKKPEVKEEKKSVDKEKMMKIAQEMVKQENAIIQALEKIQKEIDKLSLQQELPQEVQTQPVTDFKKYPKRLPRTGILDLETIKVLRDFRVETDLDEKYLKLAGADNKALNFWKQSLPKEDKTKDASAYIVIPKRGMVVPVSQLDKESEDYQSYLNGIVNDFLPYLENGAVELPGSKKLPYGSMTNKFIAGHSSDWKATKGRYKTHFQQIIATEVGDEIYIYEKQNDGSYKLYEYEVKKSYETVEGDNSPLKHIPGKKQLTLATCTPIGGNSGRWIVKAELKEDSSNMEDIKKENSAKKLEELRMQKLEGEANLASYQVSAKDSRLAHKVIAFINKKDEAVKTELFFRLFEILQSKQDKNNFLAYLEFLIAKQIVR